MRRWSAVCVGVLFCVTAFTVGFANDDFVHRLWLEGAFADYTPPPHALYEFTGSRTRDWLVAHEYVPWFTDPNWSLRFFRPLSSYSLALDHWLFGRSALAAHMHSLLWFVALAATVTTLLRRWLPQRASTLASLVYVVASGHATGVAWVASRHVLVGGTFGALALLCYVRSREGESRPGRWAAPLFFAIALCASEIGLGVAVFVVLYELIERCDALRVRLRAALPITLVSLVYLIFYASAGYGARGSAAYLSPFGNSLAFAAAAGTRVPQLAAELYAAVPSMVSSTLPLAAALALAGLGVLATGATALLVRLYQTDAALARRYWFLGAASIVSLVPLAGGFIGGRMLPLASMGAAAVIGGLLDTLLARAGAASGLRRFGSYAIVAALCLPHLVLSPLARLGLPFAFRQMEQAEQAIAAHAEVDGCPARSTVYTLPGSDPTVSMYSGVALGFLQPQRMQQLRGLVALSMTAREQKLERTGDDTFELSTFGPAALSPFEAVYRQAPARLGDTVRTNGLTAEVLAEQGGVATRVRFRFTRGAEAVCLMRWHRGALRRIQLARGSSLALPHEPGPMGL